MSKRAGLKQEFAGVITGASSGIGRALAVRCAERYKARLVLNARNNALLDETASLVSKAGGKAIVVAGDISERDTSARLVDACLSNFGALDVLVNNAGLAKPGPFPALTPDDWHYVFGINFFGALYAVYAALPHFMQVKAGKIVNVSSVAGKVSIPGSVCYAASKFAMTGFSEGISSELHSYGIDVITVCPGWVRSEFFANVKMPDTRSPTAIAERKDFAGWMMRNVLSVSPDGVARAIEDACNKGGAHELVLTAPGVIVERVNALFPAVLAALARKYPADRE